LHILIYIVYFFSFILFLYLAANSLYLFGIALAGKLISAKKFTMQAEKRTIAILIPCYKEDLIILDTAAAATAQDYPDGRFTVTVIADKLQPQTIEKLRSIPVRVLPVDVDMKSRSLHAALEAMDEQEAEIVMILDADNIMGAGCLEKINDAFSRGYRAVQCHRTAKNKNTAVALLDAMSEEININLFRRGPSNAGLSAAPIGSGMAFKFALIKSIFSSSEILNNPGEDREIDMQLMKRKIKMEFIEDAFVYDEKVASARVFEKQRVRWLEAQMNHLRRFNAADMRDAPRTILYYNKFFQTLLLPRILMLLLFCVLSLLLFAGKLFAVHILWPASGWWLACMGLYLLTLWISIPFSFYRANTIRALLQVPVLMFSMMKAVLQMKKKRTEFIHTPKSFKS
jgi:cellulose synthase/poly-beta-1,6-N-acetylglucosamine synthase-like glycosyltransferase